MSESNVRDRWEEFLNPDVLRPRLMSAAIYIAGYEAIKDAVVGRIRDFFWTGFGPAGDKFSPEYESKVLSRHKKKLQASLDWLKNDAKAIDDADIGAFDRVTTCRNLLAHQLLSFVGSDGFPPDFEKCFHEMVALLHKIDSWWIVNVEIPINPDLDGKDIDYDGIRSGRVMALQLLCDIALGDPEKRRYYYEEFRKRGAQ